MKFNPEDGINSGPRCRNCHKGSSSCGACHNTDIAGTLSASATTDTAKGAQNFNAGAFGGMFPGPRSAITDMFAVIMDNMGLMAGFGGYPHKDGPFSAWTTYLLDRTAGGNQDNKVIATTVAGDTGAYEQLKSSRTASWTENWRLNAGVEGDGITNTCSDDGLSWPHRTLGWKMLKDDLFGIDVTTSTSGDATVIAVGQTRSFTAFADNTDGLETLANADLSKALVAHDLDSVCLDCHQPTVWNATKSHANANEITNINDPAQNDDAPMNPSDDYNDDVLFRGLP